MTRMCITGGGGFIGSHFADRLLNAGHEVVVVDNFSSGHRSFLSDALGSTRCRLVEGDVLDEAVLDEAFAGCEWVIHLQANADVRHGLEHPTLDLQQNTVATSKVLEAMRRAGITRILFSSTGSIYGEPDVFPTPEDAPFPVQTSLYGASKLACEGLIAAYVAGFDFTAIVCRFVSILGERYTHGHVLDFYNALKIDPSTLTVLGNGRQEKSYLYVGDCIEAMHIAMDHHRDEIGVHIYNLGTDESIVVDESVEIITQFLNIQPAVNHTGGSRGWIGDSPLIRLDTARIRKLGWTPTMTIRDGIIKCLEWFELDRRATTLGSRTA